MSEKSRLEIVYKELGDEHRRLLELVDRLRSQQTMEGLLPLLDRLRTLLIVHFAREQLPDGFYEVLGERAQDRRDEIQQLIADHGGILSFVNALLDDAKSAGSGDEADVLNRVSELIDRLHDHEYREHHFAEAVMANGGTRTD